MINSRIEVDLLEAADMLNVPAEIIGKLLEEGKIRARRSGGNLYFMREEIEAFVARQIDEVIAEENS